MTQKGDIPVETRIILLERDMELLKLRDSDIRAWQDSVNRTSYKIESLEKSLDYTLERFDELKLIFKETQSGQKTMQDVLIQKIDEMNKASAPEEKAEKTSWQGTVESIVKVVFIILFILAGLLGIKLPGGLE